MRLLLFTGKGGAGTTTVAAATAAHAARCGVKTLVLSTGASAGLQTALDVDLADAPAPGPRAGRTPRSPSRAEAVREVAPGLSARQVDPGSRGGRPWRALQEHLLAALDLADVEPMGDDELTVLPGAEDVQVLLELRDAVRHGSWDLVVADCGPSDRAVRLLAAPEGLRRYLERLLPVEQRVLRALAAGSRPPVAGEPRPDHVVAAADRLRDELAGVGEVLGAATTSARLVLTPESAAVAEARRALTALSLHGIRVDGVVANRVVPDGGADPWRRGWARAHAELLASAEAAFAPLPMARVGYARAEPRGPQGLAPLGTALHGRTGRRSADALVAAPRTVRSLRVERSGEEFVLVLELPLARREDVRLARRGDDLLLAVAGTRRVLTLPSALRRCAVAGASVREGALRVRFVPDPALWRPL